MTEANSTHADSNDERLAAGPLAWWTVAWLLCLVVESPFLHAHEPTRPRQSGQAPARQIHKPTGPTCSLTLELVDAKSGESLPGIVQVLDADGHSVDLAELVNRGQGIEQQGPIHDWWVLPKRTALTVPAAPLVIRAIAGLETELATLREDLTGKTQATLRIPLARFAQARRDGYVAGNTHLHLMKLSRQQADRYLQEVPLADGLDIVFLSYLERAEADLEYTSNKYTPRDLERLSHEHLHFGHGEEHRHNFGSHGEGYGHILLLDIPYIIQPVSIGPGITKHGPDAPPLQDGHRQGPRARAAR